MMSKEITKKFRIWCVMIILTLVGLAITVPNAVKLTKIGWNLKQITSEASAKMYAVDPVTADKVAAEAQEKRDVYYENPDKQIREFSNSPWKLFILAWKWSIIIVMLAVPIVYFKYMQYCVAQNKKRKKLAKKCKKATLAS